MKREYKSPTETAEMLIEIYEASFGGKSKGRYLIKKKIVKEMSGRDILQGVITLKIIKQMSKFGYGMFIVEDKFAIVKNDKVLKWREVPVKITSLYINGADCDEEEDYEID